MLLPVPSHRCIHTTPPEHECNLQTSSTVSLGRDSDTANRLTDPMSSKIGSSRTLLKGVDPRVELRNMFVMKSDEMWNWPFCTPNFVPHNAGHSAPTNTLMKGLKGYL